MKTTKESDLLLKNKNIRDRIANFEKGKPVVNGKSDPDSKIPVHGVTVDSSVTDKSPALPPPPEFGDSVQLEIIPPPSGFNLSDNLESPTYNSAFHHSDSSSVSTLSTLSDDHVDAKMKHSYEDLIAPPPPGFGDNNEDSLPSVIPPPPDFGESKAGVKSNQTVNKPFLSKPLSSWQCLDVLDWLDSIQMAQYKKSFQQHCIDGKKLGGLQRNDYIQLGVTQVGHRMTMERAIKKASNIITGTHLWFFISRAGAVQRKITLTCSESQERHVENFALCLWFIFFSWKKIERILFIWTCDHFLEQKSQCY